jgi:hypothetical protein|nr:MAG TPA: structural protein [Caudoviricetes sp.]
MTEYVFTLSDKTPSVEIDVKETAIAQGAGQDLYDRAKRELGFTGTFEEFLTKFKGERGEKGEDGAAGAKGDTGERGIPGERGADGLPGAKGDTGDKGADGLPGAKGERGADGAKGEKGDTGERGPIGPQGPQGLPGPQGQRGETGQQGLQGLQGPVGLTGPKGDTGPKGADGLQGPIGPQGLQGERGQDGQKGERGEQGPIGPTGPQGPIGLTGPKGVDGRDGVGIAQKLTLSGNTLTLSDGGGSVTLPSQAATNAPTGQANEYEIHGTGMPNGKIAAPVGTTYVDTVATNGALKWIKRTGTDNQGWEVLTGDTGWRTLTIASKLGNSYLKVRRKNDTVMYQFGGLSWGWFGVVRRGGPGYSIQPSDRERNVFILGLHQVPQGFRSEFSLIGGIYNDKGTPYGTWYLGGPGDGNMIRFQFTDPVPTDRDIGDIRVSSIMYLTNDPWPDRLP